jgi:hypothetical protein
MMNLVQKMLNVNHRLVFKDSVHHVDSSSHTVLVKHVLLISTVHQRTVLTMCVLSVQTKKATTAMDKCVPRMQTALH